MHNLCHAQNDGVHIPHPTDCSKFVQCDKSCAVVKNCAKGTLFDDSLGNCYHEYLVNCPKISKKAITDFSNLAKSDIDETYRKFGGTAPKNPNPNYIEIQMENELKLSTIETEYDDEYAATETTIKPDIELGIDTANEEPETTHENERPRTAQDTVVNWLLETNEVENNFHDANIVPIPYIRTENLQWKK